MSILLSEGNVSSLPMLISLAVLFGFMYFFMIRPQQKEMKKKNAMLAELAVGDTVLTTSGFYGVIIDIADDTVIVEFGSNKNCRIPMQKDAVAAVEKPGAEEDVKGCKAKKCFSCIFSVLSGCKQPQGAWGFCREHIIAPYLKTLPLSFFARTLLPSF